MSVPRMLAVALVFLPSLASAQDHRRTIMVQLDTVAGLQVKSGYRADGAVMNGSTLIGLLKDDGMVMVELSLQKGREYYIPAGCDSDCEDLDLKVLAPDNKTVLDEDALDDDVPIVDFSASETGPHMLVVSMPKCKTNTCYFGFRVLAR